MPGIESPERPQGGALTLRPGPAFRLTIDSRADAQRHHQPRHHEDLLQHGVAVLDAVEAARSLHDRADADPER